MIRSFKDKTTENIWNRHSARKSQSIAQVALRKLRMIHAASELKTLASPPSNHLEALKGDRAGQHSIRINDQYRVCFVWDDGDAYEVEIADYH